MRLEDAIALARESGSKVWHPDHGLELYMDMHTLLREDYEVVEVHKPCPFCGGEAEYVGFVQCNRCLAMTGTAANGNDKAKHWAAWDRRTP